MNDKPNPPKEPVKQPAPEQKSKPKEDVKTYPRNPRPSHTKGG